MVESEKTFFEKFMGIVNKIGSAIMLNLLFLLCCLPVVTIGAATSGLYSAIRFTIRGDSTFRGFWEGFKTRWLRSCVGMLICMAVTLYAYYNLYTAIYGLIMAPHLMGVAAVITVAIHLVMFLAAFLLTAALIPVNLYFQNDVNGWLTDAWRLIRYAPLQVFAVGVIMWLPVVLMVYFFYYVYWALLVFVAVYYATMGVVTTGLLKNGLIRILQQYHSEEAR